MATNGKSKLQDESDDDPDWFPHFICMFAKILDIQSLEEKKKR